MIQRPLIKARVVRLRDLTDGLGKEVTAQETGDRLLLRQERRQYLDGMLNALAGIEDAPAVAAGVVNRMKGEGG